MDFKSFVIVKSQKILRFYNLLQLLVRANPSVLHLLDHLIPYYAAIIENMSAGKMYPLTLPTHMEIARL